MYINGRNVVITKKDIEKACRCSNPPKYLGLKLAEFVTTIIDEDTTFSFNSESDFIKIIYEGMEEERLISVIHRSNEEC